MALYAIGDLHLSFSVNKPMDVFGGRWNAYVEKLEKGFSTLNDDDITVLCGDISWGMNLEETLADFQFIERLPGKKIILKGNHDYWWETVTKTKKFFEQHDISSIDILHNNCFFYEDIALCGTRGWFYEEEKGKEQDKKILNRELGRLEASLKAAGEREKICFLHYPPRYRDYISKEVVALLEAYEVKACYYGHLHGQSFQYAVQGMHVAVDYKLVSADYLQFIPWKIA